ncbi:MAG: AAA family ATPase, partial [Bacteroidia bacterium]
MEYTNLPSSDPAGAFNLSKSASGETPLDIPALNAKIREQSAFIEALQLEMDKVIVGQKHLTDRLLIGLLTNGHILLEGLPGLAKTLSITTLAKSTQASFSRIQFTPDLLPADILG